MQLNNELIDELNYDDTGEVYLGLDPLVREQRSTMIICMKNVFDWEDQALNEFKRIIQKHFQFDKQFFKEVLTNGENDCSPLLLAYEDVFTDEEILFLAMTADEKFGRIASAFSVFATEEQKKDTSLVNRIIERFPEAKEYLDSD